MGNSNLLRINMKERYTKRLNYDPFKIYLEASTKYDVIAKVGGVWYNLRKRSLKGF